MSQPVDAEIGNRIQALLESLRLPETDEEIAAWFASQHGDEPSREDEAESMLVEIESDPGRMLGIALELVRRVDPRDLPNLGIILIGPLLVTSPLLVEEEFEKQIRESEAFRAAFARVSMTGVPLDVQKRMNAAMLEAGADPRSVVEYDEEIDEA